MQMKKNLKNKIKKFLTKQKASDIINELSAERLRVAFSLLSDESDAQIFLPKKGRRYCLLLALYVLKI